MFRFRRKSSRQYLVNLLLLVSWLLLLFLLLNESHPSLYFWTSIERFLMLSVTMAAQQLAMEMLWWRGSIVGRQRCCCCVARMILVWNTHYYRQSAVVVVTDWQGAGERYDLSEQTDSTDTPTLSWWCADWIARRSVSSLSDLLRPSNWATAWIVLRSMGLDWCTTTRVSSCVGCYEAVGNST